MNDLMPVLLKDTYSLSQLKHRLRILKTNLLKSFFGGQAESIPPADLNWLKSLPSPFYTNFTKDNVYKIFSDLEDNIEKFTVLTMYLTFEPDEPTLSQIGSFARKTLNFPSLILDIKIEPHLVAGAAFSWKGVYKDYSLQGTLAQRKAEILQGFRRFLR